ncbi:MAG: MFS transporter [Croceicoccus sp.]|nr:MFS transporter [Croceicoccus sp.]
MKSGEPPRSATPSPAYSWYVLAILTAVQTTHGIDRAIIGLILEPMGREFGLSDGRLGVLAGFAYGIFFAMAAIPFGVAVDRFNRRNIMAAALTVWSASTAFCGLAVGFWSMFASRAVVGISEAAGSPTGISILSDYFDKNRRATAIGIWYLSSGVGLAIAFVAGGAIVQNFGWRWAFIAAGIPGILLAPVLLFGVREPVRGGMDASEYPASNELATKTGLRSRIAELLARPGLAHCIFAIILIATGIYGMSTWLTTFLIRVHGMPIADAGLLIAISYGVLGSAGGLAAGWAVDLLNRRRGGFNPVRTALFGAMIPFATALTGLGTVYFDNLGQVIAAMLMCGFFSASYNGPVYSVIVHQAGPRLRGLAVSLVQLGANLIGVGAGTYLIGAVSEAVGGTRGVAWGIGFAMIFVAWGGLHLLLATRSIRIGQQGTELAAAD